MSAPIAKETALYLPDVETHHQPGIYHDLITAARAQVPEMSQDGHRRQGKALAERGYIRD